MDVDGAGDEEHGADSAVGAEVDDHIFGGGGVAIANAATGARVPAAPVTGLAVPNMLGVFMVGGAAAI